MAKPAFSQLFTRFIPSSTFAQTALLIGGLLFINQLVSYLSVTHYFISPSYKQINKLISNQINTFFVHDINDLTEEQKWKLRQTTGMRFHDEVSALHAGLGNATYYDFMSQQVSEQLQAFTEIRIKSGEDYVVWIKPPQNTDIWISIPLAGANEKSLSPLTMYFIVIGALSVTGGWLFVRRLNRPLQALQTAARKVGKGHFPEPLPLVGSTEVVAVTEAFNKMSQGIKQLESDRIIMTAGISHDLRTPLTRIRLASEMLPQEQEWVKDGIDHDIGDLNSIIDQFIDYARQDQQEAMETANLNDLISESVDARSIEANHNIELDLKPLPPIKLRIIGIKRVIENLIENAFRYGSDKIKIKSGLVENNKYIFCAIRDFGDGIDESKLDDLFTPFMQGDAARGSSGSGLGLAIVKRIIESHGGKMQFKNHPDGGLNAGFALPIMASDRIILAAKSKNR
ncbi:two-component system sensor histidine kinase EnvZ [Glaciecola petra]|uniref:histidine kinase n=1 Tax=Glaciecola petra TaxID=3075602 RepID=A0ABU2ZRG1_9ALTE|nr:two-component system sensor histidine kinase EnvZ [Aestuariibacter sp. P117]MDT0595210.1 two-component system sensor histidine kinase EnvZ [Aestuariibacter sp. P117]